MQQDGNINDDPKTPYEEEDTELTNQDEVVLQSEVFNTNELQ